MNRSRRAPAAASLAAILFACLPVAAAAFPQPPEKSEPPAATAATTAAQRADSAAAPGDSAAAAAPEAAPSKERRRAEALYAKGYEEARAAADLAAAGKAKESRKKYESALRRFDEAVRLDDRYFEAWNMLGYCARRTGDLKRSFDAYDRCLALNPDYAPAHEYRGEAYLMNGETEKARAELEWLRARSSDQAAILESAIEAAEKGKAGGSGSPGGW